MKRSKSSKSRRKKKPDAMASLPDDVVVDILSRLPVKSLCRCKGVSRRWRSLITHEDYCRKFPQSLPGLFYNISEFGRHRREARHFTNVWHGPRHPPVMPPLSVLTGYADIGIVDCCNGMLLCRTSEGTLPGTLRYVLCNPAEGTMITLPDSGCGADERVARLAFDPTLYPEPYVFEFVYNSDSQINKNKVVGANIYSPERLKLGHGVTREGETWATIPLPEDAHMSNGWTFDFIGIYKEHLCYIGEVKGTRDFTIWILEDYKKVDWVKKHQVSVELLCEKEFVCQYEDYYDVVGILQDCNFILYVKGRTLMAYDVDRAEVHGIQNLEEDCFEPYFLYVPFYKE